MKPLVFVGPTLSARMAREFAPELDYRPPARQGDVYRAARGGVRAIGIIDGELDQALPVWHKEILWALAQGVAVFGAASMGALRAVELAPFGMIGVGAVYGWFRDGTLEDDDEVVVAMASSEFEYRPSSDSMVNIRATLEHAERAGALSAEHAFALVRYAKAMHFAERSFAALHERIRSEPELAAGCSRLWPQLSALYIDVKREDARLLLEQLRVVPNQAGATGQETASRAFALAPTSAWQAFMDTHSPIIEPSSEADALLAAYHRALALELARASGAEMLASRVQATSEAFRREHGLHDPDAARAWLIAEGFDLETFTLLMRDEALVRGASEAARDHALAQLPIVEWLTLQGKGAGDAR